MTSGPDLPAEEEPSAWDSAASGMAAQTHRFEVAEEHQGERLDVFLTARLPEASRVRIRHGIDAGEVTDLAPWSLFLPGRCCFETGL